MFCGCDPDGSCEAYLYQPAYCLDFELRGPVRPYSPQPGDILLATDDKIFWKITHNLAGTGHPHHTGVVFQRPDGSMAVLEAGPHDTVRINNLDWYPHMVEYEQKGRIWIRQRKCPLTPEQSACLTEFCLAQEGKFFALGRLGKQVTLFRSRGPLRTAFMGQPHGPDRRSYYCSELAMEALVAAGRSMRKLPARRRPIPATFSSIDSPIRISTAPGHEHVLVSARSIHDVARTNAAPVWLR